MSIVTIFVKCHGGLDVRTAKVLLRDNVVVKEFATLEAVGYEDVIIVSKSDDAVSENVKRSYNVIVYEDVVDKILANCLAEYRQNYDYYHLRHQLDKATRPTVDTLVSGSSYGLFGIEESMMQNTVNLSLASQDLYYTFKGIRYVLERNKNIRNIVLCASYYYFYSDLSRTQNDYEIQRIAKVYSPIFKDKHNCFLMPPKQRMLFESDIFAVEDILQRNVNRLCAAGYFANMPRKNAALKLWGDNRSWCELTEEEKQSAGRQRAVSHNENLKHINSLLNNVVLFMALVDFCTENNIKLTIAVPPASKYYKANISEKFKDMFYEIRGGKQKFAILDCWDDSSYTDEDFNDTDHLSDSGAVKFTEAVMKSVCSKERLF